MLYINKNPQYLVLYDPSELRKALEKKFFNLSFPKIKKHPALKNLKLDDEEIINNRLEIQKVLNSWKLCGEEENKCYSIHPHYIAQRNADNQIILKRVPCNKQKAYESLLPEEVNSKITSAISDPIYRFSYEDVLKNISDLSSKKQLQILNNLGSSENPINNTYLTCEDDSTYNKQYKKEALTNIYAFHSVLTDTDLKIIKSSEIKRMHTHDYFRTNLSTREIENYASMSESIMNTESLIVIDFGKESDYAKKSYYLDYFSDLLETRNKLNKTTCIITDINWQIVINNLKKLPDKQNRDLFLEKVNSFEQIMKKVFFKKT